MEARNEHRNEQRNEQRNEHPLARIEQPLGFSFGPQNTNPNTEKQLRDLMDNLNEANREVSQKKKECE